MKKRGLSTVVTTLIIILLVLVAVGIVWVVIANLIEEGSEQIFLDKFTVDLEIKKVSVDENSSSFDVDIKRNAGKGNLAGLKFIFSDGVNSEEVDVTSVSLNELAERRFTLVLSDLNVSNVKTVAVAPLYTSDSGKTLTGVVLTSYNVEGASSGTSCIPDCSGKVCGADGCGGTCAPGCQSGETCSVDQSQCLAGINPCSLTSASWGTLSAVEGTNVTLNAAGTQCSSTTLNYSIYERETGTDTFITSMAVSSLSTSWTSQWLDDGLGQGDPEYYFTVTVVDNPSESITSSGGDLAVTQVLQTCASQGGDICTTGETCSGNIISASDSSNCCDVTCTPAAAVCGNSAVETGEQCDDGNTVTETCTYGQSSCTVCSSTCQNVSGATSYCGDGTCDSSNENSASCSADCTSQVANISIEAESGNNNGFLIVNDSGVSGGYFIQTPGASQGDINYTFNIATAGEYKFVGQVMVADAGANSFFFYVDGGAQQLWDISEGITSDYGIWFEDDFTNRGTGSAGNPESDPITFNLTSGQHVLRITGREANAMLDYFKVVHI